MSKKRILYVTTSLGFGGAEKLILYYLKELDKSKYEFFVCCLREKPEDLLQDYSNYAEVINLKIRNKFNPSTIFKLLKVFKKLKPDIIHTHLFQPRVYTSIVRLFYNHSVFITHKHNNVNLRKHHIFILMEMFANLSYKKIIAISKSVKDSLKRFEFIPDEKIYVLPNCINFNDFRKNVDYKENTDKKQLVIGVVGRLERQKGIKYLLMAMKYILSKFPNARLEIIGDGSLYSELKEISVKLGISNSVIFFGKFANVIPFYNKMDVFVLPSIYEGFGIVLLEAMASGVPVVATNVEGIKEVVIDSKCGLLVLPENPESIAKAVLTIIENQNLRKSLISEGVKRAQLFDVQEHVMKLDKLYTNLLGTES